MQIQMSTDIARGDARCCALRWPSRRSAYTLCFGNTHSKHISISRLFIFTTQHRASLSPSRAANFSIWTANSFWCTGVGGCIWNNWSCTTFFCYYKQNYPLLARGAVAFPLSITIYNSQNFNNGLTLRLWNLDFTHAIKEKTGNEGSNRTQKL
jgi:hypothetical protein